MGKFPDWPSKQNHRLAKNLKFSFNKSCAGVFLKANMYSTYIWSVNSKPFNSKTVNTQKRRILTTFLRTEKNSGRLFTKYKEGMAEDIGMGGWMKTSPNTELPRCFTRPVHICICFLMFSDLHTFGLSCSCDIKFSIMFGRIACWLLVLCKTTQFTQLHLAYIPANSVAPHMTSPVTSNFSQQLAYEEVLPLGLCTAYHEELFMTLSTKDPPISTGTLS